MCFHMHILAPCLGLKYALLWQRLGRDKLIPSKFPIAIATAMTVVMKMRMQKKMVKTMLRVVMKI